MHGLERCLLQGADDSWTEVPLRMCDDQSQHTRADHIAGEQGRDEPVAVPQAVTLPEISTIPFGNLWFSW
jgi:hypothetical protein